MAVVAGPPANTVTGDAWTSGILLDGSPYVGQMIRADHGATNLPPYHGNGYIAGEYPDGLVTFNGTGTVRTLDLFDRETNTWIMSTQSASDGTYLFAGLNTARQFDVRARGNSSTELDLIASQVMPIIGTLAVQGTFTDVAIFKSCNQILPITGGVPPYSGPTITSGSVPSGLSLTVSGSHVVLSGISTATAIASFDFDITSSDGQTVISSQNFDIFDSGSYRYWRCEITANNGDAYTSIQEMQFNVGATIIHPGIGTASSSFINQGPDKAYDGDTTSINSWTTATGATVPHWLAYDFGIDVSPTSVTLWPQNRSDLLIRSPMDFKIQFSGDNGNWHDMKTVTGETTWALSTGKTYTLP